MIIAWSIETTLKWIPHMTIYTRFRRPQIYPKKNYDKNFENTWLLMALGNWSQREDAAIIDIIIRLHKAEDSNWLEIPDMIKGKYMLKVYNTFERVKGIVVTQLHGFYSWLFTIMRWCNPCTKTVSCLIWSITDFLQCIIY